LKDTHQQAVVQNALQTTLVMMVLVFQDMGFLVQVVMQQLMTNV
jgi:hypothetical protein